MKRGESGLSFVVGIDKPEGLTSHDVVNRCRRIFGEKRVGHTGTLDPLASGAMAVCVGPATKLSNYLTFHDKSYLAGIRFGAATDTDDAEGRVIAQAAVPDELADGAYAQKVLDGIVGRQSQMPPAYSAVKVGGVKSYEAARKGSPVQLQAREVEVYHAGLVRVKLDGEGRPIWIVRFEVSAGTYIRSIARDLGVACGTAAHLGKLRRLRSGALSVRDCVTPGALGQDAQAGRLDPIALLGLRFMTVDGYSPWEKAVANGAALEAGDVELREPPEACAALKTPRIESTAVSQRPLDDGELVAMLSQGKLAAIYGYERASGRLKARCGFAQGVSRGTV